MLFGVFFFADVKYRSLVDVRKKHFVPLLPSIASTSVPQIFPFFCERKSIEKLKNIQHVCNHLHIWTFCCVFFCFHPLQPFFSLYIFFNFIIHFSPVFRARYFLPLFAFKSTIEGGSESLFLLLPPPSSIQLADSRLLFHFSYP